MKRTTRPVVTRHNPDAPRIGNGVYDLEDLRQRCRIDPISGCWHWGMALNTAGWNKTSITPYVSLPPEVLEGRGRCTVSASRAAWLMSGRLLRPGQVVWRTCTCDDCIAPHHLKAGTKAEEGAWMRQNGHLRGDPRRAATNLRIVTDTQAYTVQQVREVERRLSEGEMQKDLAAEMGIHKATISKIARGKHLHQRGGGPLVRGASVFALAEATA